VLFRSAEQQQQEEQWEGHDEVDEPADDGVGGAAVVAGHAAEQDPDQHRQERRAERDLERDPPADGPLGRDLFERVLVGGRISLEVAFGATFLAMLIGILLGGAAGYYGGTTDAVVGRLIDFVMAFPLLLLLLLLGNTVGDSLRGITLHGSLQPGVFSLVLLIGVFAWFYPARIVRGEVSALKESEFVTSARMVGAGEWRILRAHILPHVMPLMLAYSAFLIATTILMEAGLSFLNVGVRLPTASWGSLLTAAWGTQRNPQAVGPQRTIWMTLVPTLVIFIAAAAWMLFGEGLRRALDPRGE